MTRLPVWPVGRIEEALSLLGDCDPGQQTFPALLETIEAQRDLEPWIHAAAAARELEATPLRICASDLEEMVRGAAPAILVVLHGVLAVRTVSGRRAVLLTPDGAETSIALAEILGAMRQLWQRRCGLPSVEPLLEAAAIDTARRDGIGDALRHQMLAAYPIDAGWTVRVAPSALLGRQLARTAQPGNGARLLVAGFSAYTTTLLAWFFIGRGALAGELDRGWVIGWGLALVTAVVFRSLGSFWQGALAIGFGSLFKRRLLFGTLRLDSSDSRRDGLGRVLSRVLESDAAEDLALTGGLRSVTALVELVVAGALLARTGGATLVAVVVLLAAFVSFAAIGQYALSHRWTLARFQMTHELIERLLGQRTRVIQEDACEWHADEDRALARYAALSRRFDRFASATVSLAARGFLLLAFAALVPQLLSQRNPQKLAVALGAIVLGQAALTRLGAGLSSIVDCAIAWRSAGPIFRAATNVEEVATAAGLAALVRPIRLGETVLEAYNLGFRHSPEREAVFDRADLAIRQGEHLLLQGTSGSGKSTLVSLLGGILRPTSGMLLLGGLDRQTLGAAAWRRRVAVAPQFHENHLMHGSLAFNLLMGREWPPLSEDLDDATEVLSELGLSALLSRMPNGLRQIVGETGWRLSHGEQSRIFIARALLQRSNIIVLDESFAALDPETIRLAMDCVRRRARTLIVVAHP